jgi:hypothetical protein
LRPWPAVPAEPESERGGLGVAAGVGVGVGGVAADGGGAGGVARVRREGAIGGFTVEWPVWHEVAGEVVGRSAGQGRQRCTPSSCRVGWVSPEGQRQAEERCLAEEDDLKRPRRPRRVI